MTPAEIAEIRAIRRHMPILAIMNVLDKTASIAELHEIFGGAYETIANHLQKLEEAGRVRRVRGGYQLTPFGRRLLPGFVFYLSTASPQVFAENPREVAENPRAGTMTPANLSTSGRAAHGAQPCDAATDPTKYHDPLAENPREVAENPREVAENPREILSTGPTTTTIKNNSHGDGDNLIKLARTIADLDGSCPYVTAYDAVKRAHAAGDSIREIAEQIGRWDSYCHKNGFENISLAVARNIRDGERIE